jgi:hypothetical protein
MADVRLRGVTRLRATLERAEDELADMERANAEAAQIVASAASARAPRVTGRLAASLSGDRLKARATVRSTAPYAIVITEGYPPHNIAANPFVERAATETQDQWMRTYDGELQRVANSIKGV